MKWYTVEPPNNGQVGDEHFVIVQRFGGRNVGQYIGRGQTVCPLFRVSIIRGSTVIPFGWTQFAGSAGWQP